MGNYRMELLEQRVHGKRRSLRCLMPPQRDACVGGRELCKIVFVPPVCSCQSRDLWVELNCLTTVPCCFSELHEVQERDRKVIRETEKIQKELSAAMQEEKENAE